MSTSTTIIAPRLCSSVLLRKSHTTDYLIDNGTVSSGITIPNIPIKFDLAMAIDFHITSFAADGMVRVPLYGGEDTNIVITTSVAGAYAVGTLSEHAKIDLSEKLGAVLYSLAKMRDEHISFSMSQPNSTVARYRTFAELGDWTVEDLASVLVTDVYRYEETG